MVAFGAINALSAHGVDVGKDFSLIGFDNIAESEFYKPPLTTVTTNTHRMGDRGAQILLAMIEQPATPAQVIIEPAQLVLRQSCAPPPHNQES